MENTLVSSFLKDKKMNDLYSDYLKNPTKAKKNIIENHFAKHVKMIKILSYFSRTLPFEAQRYDKKIRGHSEKFRLILNQEEGIEDLLLFEIVDDSETKNFQIKSLEIGDYISNEQLYKIVEGLKPSSKELLYLLYVEELEEKEIARILGVTKQAVNKRKNSILKHIRSNLKNEVEI